MRKILSALFILTVAVGYCQVSATGINPSCYMQCNGTIGITFVPGTPPYQITVTGGNNCMSPPATYTTTSAGYGVSNLCACVYTITVVDGTGSTIGSTVVQLTDPPPLGVSVTSYTPPSCSSCSDGAMCATANGGMGAYTYTWAPVGGNAPCISNVPQGSYTVCVADANGCVTCSPATLATTAVNYQTASQEFRIYPNPAADKIFISGKNADAMMQIELRDVSGKQIMQLVHVKEISVCDLPNGVYELKVTTKDFVRSQKLIISH